jgi:aspartate-semialdehyde dehydrogenase
VSAQGYRVAVVGATGAVGTIMLEVLEERRFPASEIVPFASARSAGRDLGGRVVQELTDESIQGFDVAVLSAGATISREWAPKLAAAGAVVVDNSSAWRTDPAIPLVVAEVNPEALDAHRGIIANPNCSTMQMLVALGPIHRAAGIERLVVSTYQSVSGTGVRAVEELTAQTHAVLHGMEPPTPVEYPHPIAFNVLGAAGTFDDGDDHTNEERKMMFETRKILGDESLRIGVTCARVPVINSHSESVTVETREDLSPEDCRKLLAASPGITILDDPARQVYPTAVGAAGHDDVFVGRIRRDASAERSLSMWIVSDNLRKGAATNTIQLAELLVERGLLGKRAAAAA